MCAAHAGAALAAGAPGGADAGAATAPEPKLYPVVMTVEVDGKALVNGEYPNNFDPKAMKPRLKDTVLGVLHKEPAALADKGEAGKAFAYSFGNLPDGEYRVVIPASQIPHGYAFEGPATVEVKGGALTFAARFATVKPAAHEVTVGAVVDGKRLLKGQAGAPFDFSALRVVVVDDLGNVHKVATDAAQDAGKPGERVYKDFGTLVNAKYKVKVVEKTIPAGYEAVAAIVPFEVKGTSVMVDLQFKKKASGEVPGGKDDKGDKGDKPADKQPADKQPADKGDKPADKQPADKQPADKGDKLADKQPADVPADKQRVNVPVPTPVPAPVPVPVASEPVVADAPRALPKTADETSVATHVAAACGIAGAVALVGAVVVRARKAARQ